MLLPEHEMCVGLNSCVAHLCILQSQAIRSYFIIHFNGIHTFCYFVILIRGNEGLFANQLKSIYALLCFFSDNVVVSHSTVPTISKSCFDGFHVLGLSSARDAVVKLSTYSFH